MLPSLGLSLDDYESLTSYLMYLLLHCTAREYGKGSSEANMSEGEKQAPKSQGTSRNHSVLMGSH